MAKQQKSKRNIRQVYVEDDNVKKEDISEDKNPEKSEELSVITEVKASEQSETIAENKSEEIPEAKESEAHEKPAKHHANKHKKNPVRVAAVAVTLVFSMLLSMCVGTGLALWDSEKTLSDLGDAIFDKNVYASTDSAQNTQDDELDSVPSDGDEVISEDVSEDGTIDDDVKQEAFAEDENSDLDDASDDLQDESEEVADVDVTSEIAGLETLTKAGSGDEIVLSQTPSSTLSGDPNANYPLPFTTVDESYFTDALFIGDSRLQGFGMWSGLPATYYCATGFSLFKYETTKVVQTENGKVPIFDALPYDAFTKIYIKVGLNEMGWDNDKQFEAKYVELIQKLREYEPRAIIYIHGILPVTAAKSASDKAHNNPNVIARNEKLQQLAMEQKAYYIDAGPALSDENGCLRPEMTSDGIHLASQYMTLWKQYLCEHAVVVR